MENPTFVAAFVAGVLSFISPCVLPLIPGYLSYISGVSLDEMQGTGDAAARSVAASRRRVLIASIFFILGFSFVFISLGAAASALGQFLLERLRLAAPKVAGAVVILFGLHTMGLLRIGWLYSEKRVQVDRKPTERGRGVSRGPRLCVRLDAVHRPDPGRDPGRRRLAGHHLARASSCWRSTRWASASRF